MELAAFIISIIALVGSFLFSLWTINLNRIEAIKQFYEEVDSKEYKQSQGILYSKIHNDTTDFDKDYEEYALVLAFYDKWGALCNNHYLPIWLFEGNHGYKVIIFYEGLEPYIKKRRQESYNGIKNEKYAIPFENLYKKVRKKYKHHYTHY